MNYQNIVRTLVLTTLMSCNSGGEKAKVVATGPMEAKEANPCDTVLKLVPEITAEGESTPKLYAYYQRFGGCEDGALAMDASIAVVSLLAHKWHELKIIHNISKLDPPFLRFILNHISPNVTGQEEEVKRIIKNAETKCPKDLDDLCQEIKQATVESLKPDQ